MPIGYLVSVGVVVAGMVLSLAPLRRSGRLGTLTWLLSAVVNESPFVALYWLLAVTVLAACQGDMDGPAAWWAFGVACTAFAATPVLVRRGLRTRGVVDAALDEALGAERLGGGRRRRLPWGRIVLAPLPVWSRGVRRTSNLSYGPHGRRNRLDLHRRRSGTTQGAPVLLHLHGGGFRSGRKSFYARALLHRCAREGWLCVSATYRLRPTAFPDVLADVKRAIAWARAHAGEYGADPDRIVLAGSSAGAHLAISAALTAGDASFQPGFADADTSVAAAVGLYGYYGPVEAGPSPSSPADFVHSGAPPVLIAHGDQDTFVPADGARALADRLRATSACPVAYAELPGAQHSFDLFHSVRFALLIDGILDFTTATVCAPARDGR